jgi:hypothetical protein
MSARRDDADDELGGQARRLSSLARSRLLLGLSAPLLLLGAARFWLHVHGSVIVETRCRIAASEELGFLTVRLEHELGGVSRRSPALASCRRPEERRNTCGQAVGTVSRCFYFTVQPDEVTVERPRPDRIPWLPGLLLGLGVLLLIGALVLRLTVPAAPSTAGSVSFREALAPRGLVAIIVGLMFLLAGLGLSVLAVDLLWTSASVHAGFGDFALLAGLAAALLGTFIGFHRSELCVHESGLLQLAGGLFWPFARRFHALRAFHRAHVEERRGRTARGASWVRYELVLDGAKPLSISCPDRETATRIAAALEPSFAKP